MCHQINNHNVFMIHIMLPCRVFCKKFIEFIITKIVEMFGNLIFTCPYICYIDLCSIKANIKHK